MSERRELQYLKRKVEELIPSARNARTHTLNQVTEIARSIQAFGFTNPVLIDEHNGIIAGHGRVMAAKRLSMAEVPCLLVEGLTDTEKRTLMLADNKIQLNAGWNEKLLTAELEELDTSGVDLALTGFHRKEINDLFASGSEIEVKEMATGLIGDTFWITVRGPLAQQAEALQRIKALMKELSGVQVTLGTVAHEVG